MNVNSKRNASQEEAYDVFRFYDIYNMSKGGLSEADYLGSIVMRDPADTEWCIIFKDTLDVALLLDEERAFGDFMQCVAELKIQHELVND